MARRVRKSLSLALQGGGALGAYTWGVLDRILEDDRLDIAAISGASAGAMNGVVLCEGYSEGGPEGARAGLRSFWEGVARAAGGGVGPSPLQMLFGDGAPGWPPQAWLNPLGAWLELLSRYASPYELNPLNLNPLQDLLERLVDFERVRACDAIALYVSATNVETGRPRVFTNPEITPAHIMASACLPLLFQAVVIEGEPYWDGGFMGNPPLFPLFDVKATCDILIVQINPIERPGAPRASRDIIARMNEITFNSSLLLELRSIEFVGRLLDQQRLDAERYRKMLIHVVSDDPALLPLGATAGLNASREFFERLFQIGRMAADRWLDAHYDDLCARSTVDLRRMFEGEVGPIAAPPPAARRKRGA